MRAFQAAKGLTQSKTPLDDDTINRKEFQDLLGYLRQYFELYVMFAVRPTAVGKAMVQRVGGGGQEVKGLRHWWGLGARGSRD